MKNTPRLLLTALPIATSAIASAQATYQWDVNGAATGIGHTTGAKTWNTTNAFWDLVGTGNDSGNPILSIHA
jgi:hypothetical protein